MLQDKILSSRMMALNNNEKGKALESPKTPEVVKTTTQKSLNDLQNKIQIDAQRLKNIQSAELKTGRKNIEVKKAVESHKIALETQHTIGGVAASRGEKEFVPSVANVDRQISQINVVNNNRAEAKQVLNNRTRITRELADLKSMPTQFYQKEIKAKEAELAKINQSILKQGSQILEEHKDLIEQKAIQLTQQNIDAVNRSVAWNKGENKINVGNQKYVLLQDGTVKTEDGQEISLDALNKVNLEIENRKKTAKELSDKTLVEHFKNINEKKLQSSNDKESNALINDKITQLNNLLLTPEEQKKLLQEIKEDTEKLENKTSKVEGLVRKDWENITTIPKKAVDFMKDNGFEYVDGNIKFPENVVPQTIVYKYKNGTSKGPFPVSQPDFIPLYADASDIDNAAVFDAKITKDMNVSIGKEGKKLLTISYSDGSQSVIEYAPKS